MIIHLNVGEYLKIVVTKRHKDFSRERFLDDMLAPVLQLGGESNSKLKEYYFSAEQASRLCNHERNLPSSIRQAISDFRTDKGKPSVGHAKETVLSYRFEESPFLVCKKIQCVIQSDDDIDESIKDYFQKLFAEKNYDVFLWDSFILSCQANNIVKVCTSGSAEAFGSFVFEKTPNEQMSHVNRYIYNISRNGSIASEEVLNSIVTILGMFDVEIKDRVRKRIISSLLSFTKENNSNVVRPDILIEKFTDCRNVYDNKDIFDSWINEITNISPSFQIGLMKRLFITSKKERSYQAFYLMVQVLTRGDCWFYGSEEFRSLIVENDFFLPSFDKEYPSDLRNLCHQIATLAGLYGLYSEFENVLGKRNKLVSNKILEDRYSAVLKRAKVKKVGDY